MNEMESFLIDAVCELSEVTYKYKYKVMTKEDAKRNMRDIGCALMLYGDCKHREDLKKIVMVYQKEK
jgi:hypothetical protein